MSNIINDATAVAPLGVNQVEGKPPKASDSLSSSSAEQVPSQRSPSEFTLDSVLKASQIVEVMVNEVAETSLSFSVENELSRMVVSVRSVGSDKIIRQFPPEEFLSVAKFIAAQNPDELSEDFLKGILFDQYS